MKSMERRASMTKIRLFFFVSALLRSNGCSYRYDLGTTPRIQKFGLFVQRSLIREKLENIFRFLKKRLVWGEGERTSNDGKL